MFCPIPPQRSLAQTIPILLGRLLLLPLVVACFSWPARASEVERASQDGLCGDLQVDPSEEAEEADGEPDSPRNRKKSGGKK